MTDRTTPSTPDWLPDPFGRHELRWWDGQQWTSTVSTGGVMDVDTPAPSSAPTPAPVRAETPTPAPAVPPESGQILTEDVVAEHVALSTIDDPPAPFGGRRRLIAIAAVLAVVGAGVGVALANRDDPQVDGPPVLDTTAISTTTTDPPTTTTHPDAPEGPEIHRVGLLSPTAEQNLVIDGVGFRSLAPFTGNVSCFRLRNRTRHWEAGHVDPAGQQDALGACQGGASTFGDSVTVQVTEWSDTRIVVTALGGAYGSGDLVVVPGDQMELEVADPLTGRVSNSVNVEVDPVFDSTPADSPFCQLAGSFHQRERAFGASAGSATPQSLAAVAGAVNSDLATLQAEAPYAVSVAVSTIEATYNELGQWLSGHPSFSSQELAREISDLFSRPAHVAAASGLATYCGYTY